MSTEQRKEDTGTKNRINESQTRNRRQKKKVQIAFTLKVPVGRSQQGTDLGR